MTKHLSHKNLHNTLVYIDLVGAGGTGSLVLSGLVRLHLALKSLGHPHGVYVNAWDPDTVSKANIGRQLFVPEELSLNKAIALVNRYNLGFGLDWNGIPRHYELKHNGHKPHIIISCVDSRSSRLAIHRNKDFYRGAYLIDCGNSADSGQVLIGDGSKEFPYPWDRYPDLIDPDKQPGNLPSCSLAEALHHQELFVNQWMATAALEILWQLFRHGELDCSGCYINLKKFTVRPAAIRDGTIEKAAIIQKKTPSKRRPKNANQNH